MLNSTLLSNRKEKRLVKMKFNFGAEKLHSFVQHFLTMFLNHPGGQSLDS